MAPTWAGSGLFILPRDYFSTRFQQKLQDSVGTIESAFHWAWRLLYNQPRDSTREVCGFESHARTFF